MVLVLVVVGGEQYEGASRNDIDIWGITQPKNKTNEIKARCSLRSPVNNKQRLMYAFSKSGHLPQLPLTSEPGFGQKTLKTIKNNQTPVSCPMHLTSRLLQSP